MTTGHDAPDAHAPGHGALASPRHDDHDAHGHDDHQAHPAEGDAWILVPLLVGLVIGVVLVVLLGLASGATPT